MELTDQLLKSYYDSDIDLGPGYPSITPPDWLKSLEVNCSYIERMYSLTTSEHRKLLTTYNEELLRSAAEFLDAKPLKQFGGFITASGAEAINRTMAYLSKNDSCVALLSPTIDLYFDFADELKLKIHTYEVPMNDYIDIDDFTAFVKKNNCNTIFAAIPNNPTGTNLRSNDFKKLVSFCQNNEVTLILDTCFSVIGQKSPMLLELDCLSEEFSWIMLWDTGKTFGLRHRKISCIWCSKNNESGIRNQIKNITFDIPLSEKIFFVDVFAHAVKNNYISYLNEIILENKSYIKENLGDSLPLYIPKYGSYVVLRLPKSVNSKRHLMEDIRTKTGLGVVSWDAFFQPSHNVKAYKIRLCVARDKNIIVETVKKLSNYIHIAAA